MFEHEDILGSLNQDLPIREKLEYVHAVVKQGAPEIDRIAIAIYEPKTDLLTTFVDSSGEDSPLTHYQAHLSDSESLQYIVKSGRPRIVNDLALFKRSDQEHAKGMHPRMKYGILSLFGRWIHRVYVLQRIV